MVKVKNNFIPLYFLLFFLLIGFIPSLFWGLPDESRKEILLDKVYMNSRTYDEMAKYRKELFNDNGSIFLTKSISDTFLSDTDKNDNIRIIKASKDNMPFFLSLIRAYLIRTYEPDITNILNALSSMNPKRFDFFPNTFSYGITYLVPCGVFLKILSFFNLLTLKHDLAFYMENLHELSRIYLAIRIFNFLGILGILFFLYKILSACLNKNDTFLSLIFLFFVPAFFSFIFEVKPHTYGLFYFLASYYFFFVSENKTKIGSIVSGALFASLSFSAMPVYLPYSLILLLLKYFELRKNREKFLFLFFSFFVSALIFNAYIFVYPELFLSEIARQNSFYSYRDGVFGSFCGFLKESYRLFGGLFLLFALFGFFVEKRKNLKMLSFMVVSIILGVKFVYVRFFLPVFLPLTYWLGIFLSYLNAGNKRFPYFFALFFYVPVFFCNLYGFISDSTEYSTRNEAGRYINRNIPKGANIILSELPNNYTFPPFKIYNYNLIIIKELEKNLTKFKESAYLISRYPVDNKGLELVAYYGPKLTLCRKAEKALYFSDISCFIYYYGNKRPKQESKT